MKRISDKKLASLGGKLPFSTISSAPKRIRKKPRKASEFARIYGSKQRVEFVKSLPCSACGHREFSENAHVLGNGGMSRKADANTIAPLCGPWKAWDWPFSGDYVGCHTLYDEHRDKFDAQFPDFDAEKAAAETERLWLARV